jgi:hypothetical protein
MSTHLTRSLLEASLALQPKPSRHAVGRPHNLQTIGEPRQWVEPSRSREDAISEAKRIAEEESTFGVGFAWCDMGRWYAADFRPGIADEIVSVEISKTGCTEKNEGARGWRQW